LKSKREPFCDFTVTPVQKTAFPRGALPYCTVTNQLIKITVLTPLALSGRAQPWNNVRPNNQYHVANCGPTGQPFT